MTVRRECKGKPWEKRVAEATKVLNSSCWCCTVSLWGFPGVSEEILAQHHTSTADNHDPASQRSFWLLS